MAASSDGSTSAPIGVFWDIENCRVPRSKSASTFIQRIRQQFFTERHEVEFMCVCDTTKENKDIIQELNYSQVTVVHINAICKNAADDKLRQSIRRFSSAYKPPATILLISGDVNFASDLSDLRFRHHYHIVLVHPNCAPSALVDCAHEHYSFEELVSDLPPRNKAQLPDVCEVDLWVDGLPEVVSTFSIRQRLKQLSDNCGGKVVAVGGGSALLRFSTAESAQRAKIRLQGEDVFGHAIEVSFNDFSSQQALRERQLRLRANKTSKPSNPQCNKVKQGRRRTRRRCKSLGPSTYPTRVFYRTASSQSVSSEDSGPQSVDRPSPRKTSEHQKSYKKSESPNHTGPAPYWNIHFGSEKLSHSDSSLNVQPSTPHHDHLMYSCNASDSASDNNRNSPHSVFGHDECWSAPPVPVTSPPNSQTSRRSAKFRLTPGASRPHSRNSFSSSSSNSVRSTPVFGGFEEKSNFRPIQPSQPPLLTASDLGSTDGEADDLQGVGVEVMISNLDYNISGREWKKILYSEFHQHVQILAVYVQPQPDNTSIGFVKLPTIDDARYLISQFHRKKIGYKRIHVSLVNSDPGVAANNIRLEVIALLKEVSGNRLPLFKLIELYEKRYYRGITVPDLFRMKDVVEVNDVDGSGRQVVLLPCCSGSTSPLSAVSSQELPSNVAVEWPVCKTHCPEDSSFFVEAMDATNLPFVLLQLKSFAPQVHTLMQTHNGSLPLMSFPACYTSEFGVLKASQNGVPLEHLISCVPGVNVALAPHGVKKVQWAENKSNSPGFMNGSPTLNQQLTQFSSELIDLLTHAPQCRMPFSKFISSYHHHFGKQCRVADYGYTRLMELFDAIPHIVQVLGSGSRRYITLAHRTQVKRFVTDLLRVLKSQSSKQVSILIFPSVYQKVFGKTFDIYEYGVCYLEDLLSELDDSVIQVKGTGKAVVLSIAVREMNKPDDENRTQQFATEVVDLLKHSPQCRMPFNKFIPSYHHHFGRQCRVSSYGFTKLIDLFEAIPGTAKIIEEHGEKMICLTEPQLLSVLEEQIVAVLSSCSNGELAVPEFLASFMKFHGHSLHLPDYGVSSVVDLIRKVPNIASVVNHNGRYIITLVDRNRCLVLIQNVLLLLMEKLNGAMTFTQLQMFYQQLYAAQIDLSSIESDLPGIVDVIRRGDSIFIKLCPLQMFARDVRTLLLVNHNRLPLCNFEAVYANHFKVCLVTASYGFKSLLELLEAIPYVVSILGEGLQRMVWLNPAFQSQLSLLMQDMKLYDKSASPSGDSGNPDSLGDADSGYARKTPSPYDLLNCVPSHNSSLSDKDLMLFESPAMSPPDMLGSLSSAEKRPLTSPLCKTPISNMLLIAAQRLPADVPDNRSPCYPPMPSAPYVNIVQRNIVQQSMHLSEQNRQSERHASTESDTSPSTHDSPSKHGTPRRQRIAANFQVPLSPARSTCSNNSSH